MGKVNVKRLCNTEGDIIARGLILARNVLCAEFRWQFSMMLKGL